MAFQRRLGKKYPPQREITRVRHLKYNKDGRVTDQDDEYLSVTYSDGSIGLLQRKDEDITWKPTVPVHERKMKETFSPSMWTKAMTATQVQYYQQAAELHAVKKQIIDEVIWPNYEEAVESEITDEEVDAMLEALADTDPGEDWDEVDLP